MASLVFEDSFAPTLSFQVLTGVRHIMETSLAQNKVLQDIVTLLATQVEQMRQREQSIMIMQSKLEYAVSMLRILGQFTQ